MAPFDIGYSSDLTTKISPLIEGQVPDFVQADHALFVKFLKSYYQFLEAGELRVTVNIDNLLLELETPSKVLDVNGEQIVLEDGTLITGETVGTDGKFVVGETITGSTTKATATILVDDLGNATPRMFISSQQKFQTGETITGGTSGATGTTAAATETLTLAGNETLSLTAGYANPELQPDTGNIIYLENRKPIQRASDQTEDIKIIIEF